LLNFNPVFSKISLSGLVFDGVFALVGAALCLLLMQFQALTQAPPLPDADRAV
jgi:predicted Co/Zn/Cd cation transporter (cation efflux family)